MDNSLHQQEPNAQKKRDYFAGLQIFESILSFIRRSMNWLAGVIKLTKEEQENAGIYLNHLGDE